MWLQSLRVAVQLGVGCHGDQTVVAHPFLAFFHLFRLDRADGVRALTRQPIGAGS